ncbi:acyl-CoA dehydrogenase family protein [Acidocella sp.]|uniref:acyl-CoA dehydrogenase family protein n=1 Tax=Acidocella sp. TaxID=50710 RepID=UPI003D04386F
MDFDLSEEQRLLRESVGKLLAAHYDTLEARKGYQAEPDGFSRAIWNEFAEAGLLALPFSEADGGFGAGAVETMLVMEQLGAALAIEPYLSASVLCGALLRDTASPDMKARLLPGMISGETLLALAQTEPDLRGALHEAALTARPTPEGYVLNGRKSMVMGGGTADLFIVVARGTGTPRDETGLSLLLVEGTSSGLTRQAYPTQDGFQAATIDFENVLVPRANLIGQEGQGLAPLRRAVEEATAALCAEAVGAMAALLNLTVEYLRTRKQFGVALGSFQALQHRAVDMYVALEQARSMAIYAALAIVEDDPSMRSAAIAAAKAQIGHSALLIGETATQLHGGIGLTMEYKGAHYFKRLIMIERQFGDSGAHLRALAHQGGLIAA